MGLVCFNLPGAATKGSANADPAARVSAHIHTRLKAHSCLPAQPSRHFPGEQQEITRLAFQLFIANQSLPYASSQLA